MLGIKFGLRIEFKLRNIFKTIRLNYPENFNLLGLFFKQNRVTLMKCHHTQIGVIVYNKVVFFKPDTYSLYELAHFCLSHCNWVF